MHRPLGINGITWDGSQQGALASAHFSINHHGGLEARSAWLTPKAVAPASPEVEQLLFAVGAQPALHPAIRPAGAGAGYQWIPAVQGSRLGAIVHGQ